jgi:haloacetate dehalogenase
MLASFERFEVIRQGVRLHARRGGHGEPLHQLVRVLWGEHGAVGRCFDVPALWRERAQQATGRSLPCGHYIAEEAPALLLEEAVQFFRGND